MSRVFISYRRDDALGWAGHLAADLASTFGDVARFFDLDTLPPGADFLQHIDQHLAQAEATLVLIGPRWLDLRNAQNQRRLDLPEDVVAAEVAQALARPAPVIPLLLGGASMPAASSLPTRLQRLARLNALELSDQRWAHDFGRLVDALSASTSLRPCKPAATGASAAAGVQVGQGLVLNNAKVGRVTGVRGGAPVGVTAAVGAVGVLNQAHLDNVDIGDITGIEWAHPGSNGPTEPGPAR